MGEACHILAQGPVGGRKEKEAISGSFISDRIPIGPARPLLFGLVVCSMLFGASGKANTPERRLTALCAMSPRGNGRFEIAVL